MTTERKPGDPTWFELMDIVKKLHAADRNVYKDKYPQHKLVECPFCRRLSGYYDTNKLHDTKCLMWIAGKAVRKNREANRPRSNKVGQWLSHRTKPLPEYKIESKLPRNQWLISWYSPKFELIDSKIINDSNLLKYYNLREESEVDSDYLANFNRLKEEQ